MCQKRADNFTPRRQCELYAVGNTMIYQHGRPPMPPTPWVRHDPSTERPFDPKAVPMVRDAGLARLENAFVPGRKSKSVISVRPARCTSTINQDNVDDAVRRNLETCGAVVGVACMVVAVDDVFVVPVPALMKVIGMFRSANNASIAADQRDDVMRKLADATTGWNAIAVGSAGRPGMGLKAASEQDAINDALGNCVKRDSDCHVIAIGPFTVGPN